MWAWGANGCGQLGLGDRDDRSQPFSIDALTAQPVTRLAAGASHSLAVTCLGALWAWGCNRYGQAGQAGREEEEGRDLIVEAPLRLPFQVCCSRCACGLTDV